MVVVCYFQNFHRYFCTTFSVLSKQISSNVHFESILSFPILFLMPVTLRRLNMQKWSLNMNVSSVFVESSVLIIISSTVLWDNGTAMFYCWFIHAIKNNNLFVFSCGRYKYSSSSFQVIHTYVRIYCSDIYNIGGLKDCFACLFLPPKTCFLCPRPGL